MIILVAAVVLLLVYLGLAVFERLVPHRMLRQFQRRLGNPFGARVMRWIPGWAVVETTGRRSGLPRRVPVGGRQIGGCFWLVVADPERASYVRNIDANPRVRVQVRGRWSSGTAYLLPGDNARRRMLRLNPLNGLYLMVAGREHLTIRVDLDRPDQNQGA